MSITLVFFFLNQIPAIGGANMDPFVWPTLPTLEDANFPRNFTQKAHVEPQQLISGHPF